DLPSALNHHWTKALTASADGRYLYVGIGSNSNVAERGMAVEMDRAMIWQVDAESGAHKPHATGLRNPTALAIQPQQPDKVAVALQPDYALGSHVAALGLAFSSPVMGEQFADGVFIGEH